MLPSSFYASLNHAGRFSWRQNAIMCHHTWSNSNHATPRHTEPAHIGASTTDLTFQGHIGGLLARLVQLIISSMLTTAYILSSSQYSYLKISGLRAQLIFIQYPRQCHTAFSARVTVRCSIVGHFDTNTHHTALHSETP